MVDGPDGFRCQLNAKIMHMLEGTHSLIGGGGALMSLVDLCRAASKGVRVRDGEGGGQ